MSQLSPLDDPPQNGFLSFASAQLGRLQLRGQYLIESGSAAVTLHRHTFRLSAFPQAYSDLHQRSQSGQLFASIARPSLRGG
jgi:hypothetical protein